MSLDQLVCSDATHSDPGKGLLGDTGHKEQLGDT